MLKDLCFEIIQTCPNNCRFCSSNSDKDATTFVDLATFKKTIQHFMDIGGVQEVSLSGGEPFLHPDLFEMVQFCKALGIRTVIFTSGIKRMPPLQEDEIEYLESERKKTLAEINEHEPWNDRLKGNINGYYNKLLNPPEFGSISREEFAKLAAIGLDKIVFDYQAFREETDNYLMGRNRLHTSLIGSLIRAQRAGLFVDCHFIPLKPNYREFGDLLECLEIAEVPSISILNFVPQGRGRINKEELMLSDSEMREFAVILENERKNFSGNIRVGIPLLRNVQHLCTAGTEKLDIRYDGVVLPCPAFKEIDIETMNKYGIRIYSIYDDLDKILVRNGHRKEPLCRQVYGFNSSIADGKPSRVPGKKTGESER